MHNFARLGRIFATYSLKIIYKQKQLSLFAVHLVATSYCGINLFSRCKLEIDFCNALICDLFNIGLESQTRGYVFRFGFKLRSLLEICSQVLETQCIDATFPMNLYFGLKDL